MKQKTYKLNLEDGKTIAFDFDGVIHKYSKGWQDGSIYDEPNEQILDLMLLLHLSKFPLVIISTREPQQIKDWWDKNIGGLRAEVLDFGTQFFNDTSYVGITNRKVVAQLYIDDRAYKYSGQTAQEFFMDFAESEE